MSERGAYEEIKATEIMVGDIVWSGSWKIVGRISYHGTGSRGTIWCHQEDDYLVGAFLSTEIVLRKMSDFSCGREVGGECPVC